MKLVIDTNVLLVANEQHSEASCGCVEACVLKLVEIQKSGVVVIDDKYRILGEYQNKTKSKSAKRVGDVFLKWLLRNSNNEKHVEQVAVRENSKDSFLDFPDRKLQLVFDPPDRKFVAVSNAHAEKPNILQAVDCKWLDWWPALSKAGVNVEFLCPDDVCGFYKNKFPKKPLPKLP